MRRLLALAALPRSSQQMAFTPAVPAMLFARQGGLGRKIGSACIGRMGELSTSGQIRSCRKRREYFGPSPHHVIAACIAVISSGEIGGGHPLKFRRYGRRAKRHLMLNGSSYLSN